MNNDFHSCHEDTMMFVSFRRSVNGTQWEPEHDNSNSMMSVTCILAMLSVYDHLDGIPLIFSFVSGYFEHMNLRLSLNTNITLLIRQQVRLRDGFFWYGWFRDGWFRVGWFRDGWFREAYSELVDSELVDSELVDSERLSCPTWAYFIIYVGIVYTKLFIFFFWFPNFWLFISAHGVICCPAEVSSSAGALGHL